MSYTLIPGLESFMEDTEVNVEVAVDAPEAIEETEETADASAEIAETTEESEATDEQTEMIMAQFMELGKRYDHVKKYGVDRTFMRLYNSNGELSRSFRYRFPSCESFDSTGSPYSSESVACMEGIGEALKAVWKFIVNLCKKIGAFFGRLFEAIRVRFGNLNDQIGRLRKLAQERTSRVENIDDVKAETYKMDDLNKFNKKLDELKSNKDIGDMTSLVSDSDKVVKLLETVASEKMLANEVRKNNDDAQKQYAKDEAERAKKRREAFKNFKKDANRELSNINPSTKVGDIPVGDIEKYLQFASDKMSWVDKQKSTMNTAKTAISNMQREAENMQKRDTTATADKLGSTMAVYANLMNQLVNFEISLCNKAAGMAIRAASTMLRYMKKD